ncbi:hypothetical protein OCU04_000692 [Sclerotinia nivalis]|uniref:Uncharacterized protein n=1 Tax=Sclerotinia nivalis TaxID=352851 RepID=A0A9X0AWM5_9HELO|nr:hypothetical protein OCU04_000692 [Sclerotinia nivalis]
MAQARLRIVSNYKNLKRYSEYQNIVLSNIIDDNTGQEVMFNPSTFRGYRVEFQTIIEQVNLSFLYLTIKLIRATVYGNYYRHESPTRMIQTDSASHIEMTFVDAPIHQHAHGDLAVVFCCQIPVCVQEPKNDFKYAVCSSSYITMELGKKELKLL